MKVIVITALLTQLVAQSSTHAAASKDEYELQERCGKRAEEWFKRQWGTSGIINTKTGQAIASYRNHFNINQSRYFVLLSYVDVPTKSKRLRPSTQITLFDINESKDYGSFFKFHEEQPTSQCEVNDKACESEADWKLLVAPYVQEVASTNRDSHLIFNQIGIKIGFVPEAIVRGAFLALWVRNNASFCDDAEAAARVRVETETPHAAA